VALVASSFLPRVGGVEEHVRHLALRLADRGHRVSVWSVDQGDDVSTSLDGIPLRYLPCPLPARTPSSVAWTARRAPGALAAWLRAVRADRPDLLHVHCYGANGPWATAVGALVRRPVLLSAHGETFMDADHAFTRSALIRRSLTWSLSRSAAVTGCSSYVVAELERDFGLAPGKGRVVPNGIDRAEPAGVLDGWPERYVLAVGRMVAVKGFDLLLAAFARAAGDLDPAVRLVLAGDGPEQAALARQAGELGVADRVLLPGRLDRPQVVAAMAGAETLVVPSRIEAFGIVILEGWRAGVPVVTTDRGGPPDLIVDQVDGLVVDPTDAAGLAAILVRLGGDAALRNRLGTAGAARVRAFDWDAVAADYEQIYAQISTPISTQR
jgi:glycogen(starch) synthase